MTAHRRLGLVLIAVVLVAIGAVLYALTAVSASQNQGVANISTYVRDPVAYAQLKNEVIHDLDLPANTMLDLGRQDGAYFDFSATDPVSGGGVELLAYKTATGHFTEIWQGQDAAPCSILHGRFDVPPDVEPLCSETVTFDWSSPFSKFLMTLVGH